MLEQGYDYKKAVTFLTSPPDCWSTRVAYPTSMVCPVYLPVPFWPSNVLDQVKENTTNIEQVKQNLLSTVTSGLKAFPGHKKRLLFLLQFDRIIEEGNFDIWGKSHNNPLFDELKHYRGAIEEKYDALWPYKYHFACENSFHKGYFTEKIIDPIICECLTFYDGCPNLPEFIDPEAYIKINTDNMEESFETIAESIETDQWEKRIKAIKAQKERLLFHLNPLNIIWMTLHGKEALDECKLPKV
ncbi:glycosyltransferase family 10 domain-containing protein [Chitinophaga dinghuensis]|nr:glycosyltransferase family 10 [Chitinophaga dinghuensis]